MADNRLIILDYGAGNLRSVVNAVRFVGGEPLVTGDPAGIPGAGMIILPGVGSAACVMDGLKSHGMVDALLRYIKSGRPFLGICLGLQVLFESTEEGGCRCLGLLHGKVKRFSPGLKVPHMGWNQVRQKRQHPIFDGVPDCANFYFVHSFYAAPDEGSVIAAETDYGGTFCSVVAHGSLVATQFHPEKSGPDGLRIYSNFIEMAGQC